MKILIAEDSKIMRVFIQRALKQCDIDPLSICEAENGVAALKKAKEFRPDVVLVDWNMPEMDGLQMLKELRRERNSVLVGFVTSECTDEVREAAEEAGASFFITKPFTPEQLELELCSRS